MKVIEVADYQEMSKIAGEMILRQIEKKRNSVLGLATGSTPIGTYQHLIQAYRERRVSFAEVTTFNLDEYVGLDEKHPNSYHYFMRTELLDHIDIPDGLSHLPTVESIDLQSECEHYESLIVNVKGIDLQLLGIGVNGHIGFNEPGTSFSSRTHVVELTETTRRANVRFFNSIDEVPTHAVSMGIDTIMRSREIILLISGESKAEVLDRLLREDVTEEIPASILKRHNNVTLIADQAALSIYKTNRS